MAREIVRVKLPDGFDPAKHKAALVQLIAKQHGDGFEVEHIEGGEAVAVRESVMAEVTAAAATTTSAKRQSFDVNLPKDVKAADGEKWEARLEDQYEGCYLTSFDPYLKKATLTKLNPATARCRAALAVALGVKRWDVQVAQRPDGGFDVALPRTYTPSKHDTKLEEVATSVVGAEGWYVETNAAKLTASIIPSEPPTFPPVINYPLDQLSDNVANRLLIGRALGARSEATGPDIFVNFDAAPHLQVSGTSGSGKSVLLHGVIANQLGHGSELAIIDLPHKAVDFIEFRDYVRPGGWGCATATTAISDWLPEALAAVGLVYEEGMRRAGLLADHNVTNVSQLPEAARVAPIFVVFDEVTGILQLDDVPKGLPKDHPMVVEANYTNLMRQMILSYMKKIAAELRFAGIRMVLSSQVSSVNTGIPTSLRMNLANKILQGPNPTEGNRKLSLTDAGSVPYVPENVKTDSRAGKGVGVAELDGQVPVVYKSFFATPAQLVAELRRLGIPTTDRPRPTTREIDRFTPTLDDSQSAKTDDYETLGFGATGPQIDPATGEVLTGFAKANAARRQLDAAAGTARRKPLDMPDAGPVTVTRRPDQNNPFDQSGG